MTYRVEQFVRKISSPVIVKYGDTEREFKSGEELANYDFDRNVVVTDVSADGNKIIITLVENARVNETNWVGEEQTYF
ncbi:hypothetical protein [Ruminococcus albus]|uniref:Uncharacterized protein n=1 Tax=Ruminococcus albus TaxID=1264 RepID=A0A1I1CW32_RUMAL|nr:hypothetical protein [Ruminococcus albus]SFB66266.1 hypothetical protein SAMN02910406_00022 [Ruminococcus albus]